MKLKAYTTISTTVYSHLKPLGAVFFSFVTGISMGIFTEIQLTAGARADIREFFNSSFLALGIDDKNLSHVLLKSLAANGGLFLIIALAGICVIALPVPLLALIYKGSSLGFTAALLIDTMGLKGGLIVMLKLFPPNLILIPALCGAAAASVRMGFEILNSKPFSIKKNLMAKGGSFLIFQTAMAILILLGCMIESLIAVIA